MSVPDVTTIHAPGRAGGARARTACGTSSPLRSARGYFTGSEKPARSRLILRRRTDARLNKAVRSCHNAGHMSGAEKAGREEERGMARAELEQIGDFRALRLRSGAALLEVIPGLGGMVRRLRLAGDGLPTRDLLASPSADELPLNPWFRGRILFPFNDRIPGGRYRWRGGSLELPINSHDDGSSLHGLVYARPFEEGGVSERDDGSLLLRLSTRLRPHEYAGYPFDLSLELLYRLSERSFSLEMTARNRGDEEAPVAFGWHPYFTLGERIDHLLFTAACSDYVPVDGRLLPTGEHRTVAGTPLDFRAGRRIGDAELDVALTAPRQGVARLSSETVSIALRLSGEAFRYLQLFTHPDRSSLAIEPVTAATNSFNLPALGLRTLQPREGLTGRVELSLEPGSAAR